MIDDKGCVKLPHVRRNQTLYVSKEHKTKLKLLAATAGLSMGMYVERLISAEFGEIMGDGHTQAGEPSSQYARELSGTSPDTNARSDCGLGEAKDGKDILGARLSNARRLRQEV